VIMVLYRVLIALLMLLSAEGGHADNRWSISPKLEAQASVLKKIADLKPNHAIHLGSANVIGDFNDIAKQFKLDETGPMGRDYSIKMVWAPERERALFTGANHGHPHRLNDVWEFDLGALSWALLYAPDNPRSYAGLGRNPSDVKFKDGVLVTKRGGPAVIGHTWWGITYDENNRELLFMNTWNTNQSKAIEQLGGNPDERYKGAPLWSFIPQTQQWRFNKTRGLSPRAPFGGMLEYIPDSGGAIWHTNHWQMLATWLYEPGAKVWTNLRANAIRGDLRAQSPKTEQVGYYDPERKVIISQRGHDTFEYDISDRRWSKILEKPANHETWPNGHDAFAPMYRDPNTGHGLLVDFRSNELWSYNPEDNWWTKLSPIGARMPKGRKRVAYFDIKHSVFIVIDGLDIWAYRYSL